MDLQQKTRLDLVYAESLSKTLDEWGSKNDEEAYRDMADTQDERVKISIIKS